MAVSSDNVKVWASGDVEASRADKNIAFVNLSVFCLNAFRHDTLDSGSDHVNIIFAESFQVAHSRRDCRVQDKVSNNSGVKLILGKDSRLRQPTCQSGISKSANSGFFASRFFIIAVSRGIAASAPGLPFKVEPANLELFSCSIFFRYLRSNSPSSRKAFFSASV